MSQTQTDTTTLSWKTFLAWARAEDQFQLQRERNDDHPNPLLRGRSYFEVNLYRFYRSFSICLPYLTEPHPHKILDIGSFPGVWLRALDHFANTPASPHDYWAAGLELDETFAQVTGNVCQNILTCELDIFSPLADRDVPNVLTETGFTFVSAMEIVEHLYHPGWMFEQISHSMQKGGLFFLTTNNVSSFKNVSTLLQGSGLTEHLDKLLPTLPNKLAGYRPHIREWSWPELNHLALQSGFELVEHGFYEYNYARKLIDGSDSPSEEIPLTTDFDRDIYSALANKLPDPNSLKSGLYCIWRKNNDPPKRSHRRNRSLDLSRQPASDNGAPSADAIARLLHEVGLHHDALAAMTLRNTQRDQQLSSLTSSVADLHALVQHLKAHPSRLNRLVSILRRP